MSDDRERPDEGVPAPDASGAEEALRRMMRESVEGLQPSATSLGRLRRAVPARRAHRRQVFVGAAAAVVLAGVGIPVMTHTGFVPGGDSTDRPVNAGSSHAQEQPPEGYDSGGGHQGGDSSTGSTGGTGGKGGAPGGGEAEPSPPASGGSEGEDTNDTLSTSAPACERDQLGDATSRTGLPDGQGKVYGNFRVTNTSKDACTVEGAGMVDVMTGGRVGNARIQVVDHTSGDAAERLPDPAAEAEALVLRANEAYTVEFAWVPEDCLNDTPLPESGDGDGDGAGGSTGGDAPGIPESGGTDGGDGGDPNGDTGGDSGSGEPGDSDVTLLHTPEAGDPVAAETALAGAGSCKGTVYRTGVLAAR